MNNVGTSNFYLYSNGVFKQINFNELITNDNDISYTKLQSSINQNMLLYRNSLSLIQESKLTNDMINDTTIALSKLNLWGLSTPFYVLQFNNLGVLTSAFITDNNLQIGTINADRLLDLSINSNQININAITNTKIINDAVTTWKIQNQAITTAKIA